MTETHPLHLIPLLPLLSAAIILLVGRRLGKNAVTLIACGSVAGAALLAFRAVWILTHDVAATGMLVDSFFDAAWIKAGDLSLGPGLMLDRLSSVMVLVVTGIGFLIHVYSTAYMEHDENYTRFFAYLNLFMGSMLILVLGDSLLVTFVGWEGVGLCSYLLIGFWFDKEAYATAGRKAFIVNRIGDFGFLIAIFLLFGVTGTLQYSQLGGAIPALSQKAWLGMPIAWFIGAFILLGATGKSAQIPLYVWLPDAMAGPTPVSALIHAATMVTAGVYVIARTHVIFEAAVPVLWLVAIIGALTALFAATIAIVQKDLKKVLAYSTISQLGFMFVGVGSHLADAGGNATSNYHAGIFHLMTHAFFKAGLFLGAGSIMHALDGEGDITRMGGLRKKLPHTHGAFFIYWLAIAGIPPFAGFWSKDAILAGAHAAMWPAQPGASGAEAWLATHLGTILYVILLLAALCTAFYMSRLYFLVFHGEFRGTHEQEHHIHESPPAMTVVLWILAIGSAVVGFVGIPGHDSFAQFLEPVVRAQARPEEHGFIHLIKEAALPTALAAGGIGLAWVLYGRGFSESVKKITASLKPLYKLLFNKYYIDELYDLLIVRPVKAIAVVLWKAVDTFLIDMVLVNFAGFLTIGLGKLVRYFQNGDVQRYVIVLLLGGVGALYGATHWDARKASRFELSVDGRAVTVQAKGSGQGARRIQYRVDWHDGGGYTQEQSSPVFKHAYDTPGKKKVTVEAIDPRWSTSASHSETVTLK
jgi:NADH-quinone oxidoreductase subunit L